MEEIIFDNPEDAARSLLVDATRLAQNAGQDFAVVGGWSPFLRNANAFTHPGTKDVDLLFKGATKTEGIKNVIRIFLEAKYLVSAKHGFQLLKQIKVGDQEFVFNVDLLHPSESTPKGNMMVDQIDLDIPENRRRICSCKIKSIALPYSDFVFPEFIVQHEVTATDLRNGQEVKRTVPLVDEVGVFITKIESVGNPKRPRDAFDIFLALTQPQNSSKLITNLRNLRTKYEGIDELVRKFEEFIEKKESFTQNVKKFAPQVQEPAQQVAIVLNQTRLPH